MKKIRPKITTCLAATLVGLSYFLPVNVLATDDKCLAVTPDILNNSITGAAHVNCQQPPGDPTIQCKDISFSSVTKAKHDTGYKEAYLCDAQCKYTYTACTQQRKFDPEHKLIPCTTWGPEQTINGPCWWAFIGSMGPDDVAPCIGSACWPY